MSKFKVWWTRFSIDFALLILIVLCLIGLTIMTAMLATRAHSAGCLTIDVDPRYVVREIDGDTFPVFTFSYGGEVKIRVKGVNTPEKNQPGWAEARQFTKEWLQQGPFQVLTCGERTLDRIVGIVTRDGHSLAQALKDAGLGR